jgi:hypothetical protein
MHDPFYNPPVVMPRTNTGGWFLPALGGVAFDNVAWPVLGWLAEGRPSWGPWGHPRGIVHGFESEFLTPEEEARLHALAHPMDASGAFPWAPFLGGIVAARYSGDMLTWAARRAAMWRLAQARR